MYREIGKLVRIVQNYLLVGTDVNKNNPGHMPAIQMQCDQFAADCVHSVTIVTFAPLGAVGLNMTHAYGFRVHVVVYKCTNLIQVLLDY